MRADAVADTVRYGKCVNDKVSSTLSVSFTSSGTDKLKLVQVTENGAIRYFQSNAALKSIRLLSNGSERYEKIPAPVKLITGMACALIPLLIWGYGSHNLNGL